MESGCLLRVLIDFFILMETPGDSSESEENEGSSGSRQDDTLHSG